MRAFLLDGSDEIEDAVRGEPEEIDGMPSRSETRSGDGYAVRERQTEAS